MITAWLETLKQKLQDQKTNRKMEHLYRKGADPYKYKSHPHEIAKQDQLLHLISGRRYGMALEIGCGEGAFTRRLGDVCDHLTAVDISHTAISRAQEYCADKSNIQFVQANVREMDLKAEWDLLVVSEVLYYLNKGAKFSQGFLDFISRLGRCIKSDGLIVLNHSFGNEGELEIRRGYVKALEDLAGLKVQQEVIGGVDPRKCKYLVSLLKYRVSTNLHDNSSRSSRHL